MNPLSLQTLQTYWSDPEVGANVIVFCNIFGALLLGLLVGYERSYRGRAAGMRTYGLVCMASCALTVVTGYPELWFAQHSHFTAIDPGRVIQGITTGIGFLGAGVIMRDGLNISGLTTAASIWAVSAIGVMVGLGFYVGSILLALVSAMLMLWGNKIDTILPSRHAVAVSIKFLKDVTPTEEELQKIINKSGYSVAKGSFGINWDGGQHEMRFVVVSLGQRKGGTLSGLNKVLSATKGIERFHLTHARN